MMSSLASLVRDIRLLQTTPQSQRAVKEERERPRLRSGGRVAAKPLFRPDRDTPAVIVAVAAGHPATADAGAEILADGGSAADAAVAACLASCVAETVMTGLLGGGHAIYFDAGRGTVRNLDCFVVVPAGRGAPMAALQVPF